LTRLFGLGKCPKCGRKTLFGVKLLECVVCGQRGCPECIESSRRLSAYEEGGLRIDMCLCSNKCFHKFRARFLKALIVGSPKEHITSALEIAVRYSGKLYFFAPREHLLSDMGFSPRLDRNRSPSSSDLLGSLQKSGRAEISKLSSKLGIKPNVARELIDLAVAEGILIGYFSENGDSFVTKELLEREIRKCLES